MQPKSSGIGFHAGTDPLSPENILIFAAGPLTGFPLPNSGKLVVASKSPLTGGYGDGNIGTFAAVHMRKAGYDAVIVEGKAAKPTILHVKDKQVEFLDAEDLWGLSSFEAEERLQEDLRARRGHSFHRSGWREPRQVCLRRFSGRQGRRQTWHGRGYGLQEPESSCH